MHQIGLTKNQPYAIFNTKELSAFQETEKQNKNIQNAHSFYINILLARSLFVRIQPNIVFVFVYLDLMCAVIILPRAIKMQWLHVTLWAELIGME